MSSGTRPPFGLDDVRILDTQTCYQGHLGIKKFKLQCRLYQGGWSAVFSREVLDRHQGVGVLLYDPGSDKVLLVEQFRVGCLGDETNGPWALELVAGLVDKDETPQAVAIREVQEEAGIRIDIDDMLFVAKYYNSPGGSNELLRVYCAAFDADREEGIFGLDTEAENIQTRIMTRDEALKGVASGRINNAMAIIALQWLQLNLRDVRETLAGPGRKKQ